MSLLLYTSPYPFCGICGCVSSVWVDLCGFSAPQLEVFFTVPSGRQHGSCPSVIPFCMAMTYTRNSRQVLMYRAPVSPWHCDFSRSRPRGLRGSNRASLPMIGSKRRLCRWAYASSRVSTCAHVSSEEGQRLSGSRTCSFSLCAGLMRHACNEPRLHGARWSQARPSTSHGWRNRLLSTTLKCCCLRCAQRGSACVSTPPRYCSRQKCAACCRPALG